MNRIDRGIHSPEKPSQRIFISAKKMLSGAYNREVLSVFEYALAGATPDFKPTGFTQEKLIEEGLGYKEAREKLLTPDGLRTLPLDMMKDAVEMTQTRRRSRARTIEEMADIREGKFLSGSFVAVIDYPAMKDIFLKDKLTLLAWLPPLNRETGITEPTIKIQIAKKVERKKGTSIEEGFELYPEFLDKIQLKVAQASSGVRLSEFITLDKEWSNDTGRNGIQGPYRVLRFRTQAEWDAIALQSESAASSEFPLHR